MELYELTLHELQQRLGRREISSEEIVTSVLARINQVEAKVRSFLTLTGEKTQEFILTYTGMPSSRI